MTAYYFTLALKGLRRTPWLTILMIVTLGVGLSASMVINTLRHALAMDPIPGKSYRLLQLQDPKVDAIAKGMGGWVTYAQAQHLTRLGKDLAESTATGYGDVDDITLGTRRVAFSGGLGVRYASGNFFRMFDVPLKSGRIWTREEESNASPVALLAQDVADRLFPSTSPIGQRVVIGDTVYTVIGVTGPWFPQPHYIDMSMGAFGVGGQGVFLPVTTIRYAPDRMRIFQSLPKDHPQLCLAEELLSSQCNWLSVWYLAADIKSVPPLTRSLKSQLSTIFPAPQANALQLMNVRQIVADVVPKEVDRYSWLGMAFLALCVLNASGMQLSRLMRSTSQVGIRRALGASRMDIVRQYLCDAVVVGAAGGLLGVSFTFAGLHFVRALSLDDVFYTSMARMDGLMFGAMVLLILVCSMLTGVVPAWVASRADPATIIKVEQ